ncbi:MAG: GTP cyclohydrolase FolE2 [Wenzhouxiangellaceae bacterium]
MSAPENVLRQMPDIAKEVRPQVAGQLDWVGMNQIEMPVLLEGADGKVSTTSARVAAYVNLQDPASRGIHMSRLYLHLDQILAERTLSPCTLRHLLRHFLDSHQGLSDRAWVRIDFDYLLRRPALISDNTGWRRYPVSVIGQLTGNEFQLEMGVKVLYSSTCPCSAALARQLIQQQFSKDFSDRDQLSVAEVEDWLGKETSIVATPHSQRSSADIRVRLTPSFSAFPLNEVIDEVEAGLQTPVQSAVKREDEQAFALRNGQNLMFCEDAARRIHHTLNSDERIADFWVRCRHFESLHPHNAVAIVTKGVDGGFLPIDSDDHS